MAGNEADLYLQYPPTLPEDVLAEFAHVVERPTLSIKVDRRASGLQAGIEWLLPTFAFVFIANSYFDGFLKEAGKDHYHALKKGIGGLWAYLTTVRMTTLGSSPKKLADDEYSRTFCLLAKSEPGRTVKLIIPSNATREEVEASLEAFVTFLEGFYGGQPVPLQFRGGVGLVTYDPQTKNLREVDVKKP